MLRISLFVGGGEFEMLLDELRNRKAEINALGEHYGARRIRVFGSVARGEERPDSDVDFLVDFPRGYDLFAQRLPETAKAAGLEPRAYLHYLFETLPTVTRPDGFEALLPHRLTPELLKLPAPKL